MTAHEDRGGPDVTSSEATVAGTRAPTTEPGDGGLPIADVVITVVLLAVFGWAFLDAADWSFRAALFPRIVTGAGVVFCVVKLVQDLLVLRRGRASAAGPPVPAHESVPAGGTHEDEEAIEADDVEYVFATAGARSWSLALAWVVTFFLLLYVAGLFVTAPVFSLLYLRSAGQRSWKVSIGYAVVVGVLLYLSFEVALGIATPPGLFLD
ncbi:hypothetical protein GCM10023328_04250 [Modestobacter marinus]|uniref:DUF1468 domain-containing protein n=1 Tax=Modestobacter marinus TaxID=477641 RepID=A0A846LM07_9ACTN|nr:tripartite tricarboxylate transporter TctB family protein [Modestobacter marinus]NIH67152.1 hypothetical protein [Modestobacter marinus]GGL52442.1 hypothetical protein GCM10011589_05710 [Modestobacter marinus]